MSEIVKAGSYIGRGYGTPELGESPEKHSEFYRVSVQIKGGEFDGRIVSRDFYFSGEAAKYSTESMRTLGCTFPGNDITNLEGFGTVDVPFTVVHKKYTNKEGVEKTYAEIGFINKPFGISEEARMDDAKKAAFKAKMLGTLAASAPKGNGTVTSKAPF